MELFLKYGPLRDAKTDAPLVNKVAWAKARTLLEAAAAGMYRIHPEFHSMYPLVLVVVLQASSMTE